MTAEWLAERARKYSTPFLLIALAGCIAFILWLKYAPTPPPAYPSAPGPAAVAPVPKPIVRTIERVRRVVVPGPPRIVYLDKPRLAAALRFPELAETSDNVLAVATIPPSSGNTTAAALLNQEGETRLIYRREPPSFLAVKREMGVRAGLVTGGGVLGEFYVRPARIGPVEVEVRGFVRQEVSRGADAGACVLLDWRF